MNSAIKNETDAVARNEEERESIQQELDQAQENISNLQEDLKDLNEVLEEKSKALETVKKSTSKAARVLDQALKDIATKVSFALPCRASIMLTLEKNDEIEKLASERSAIYRKCRLEEIQLPLLQGNLKNVPMEEVTKSYKLL